MRLRNGPLVNSSPKRLGIPLWDHHENAAKEFYASTEMPLIVMFKGSESVPGILKQVTYTCGVPVMYQLEEKDYEVRFNWHREHCTVNLFEIAKTGEIYEKQLLKTFDNKIRYNNPHCMEAFKKLRLY